MIHRIAAAAGYGPGALDRTAPWLAAKGWYPDTTFGKPPVF
jgi:hypothetical protein